MKYIAVILVTVVAIFFLQKDEVLSPVANEWLAKLESDSASTSEAFIYLYGIAAAESDNPKDVGSQYFSYYKKAEDNRRFFDETLNYEAYPVDKKLPIPDKNQVLYCALWEDDCFKEIIKNQHLWSTEVAENTVILERYRKFISFSEFTTLSQPSAQEVIPEYRYLKYGSRLALLESFTLAGQGSPSAAISKLVSDLVKQRQQLVVADNLIYKVFLTTIIADNLDAMAYIRQRYSDSAAPNVPYLTLAELSIKAPIIREFGMMSHLYSGLDGRPEFLDIGGNLPSWLVRLVFKPNKTINNTVSLYENYIEMAVLPPEAFAKLGVVASNDTEKEIDYLNFIGSVLGNVAEADYQKYIAMLYDLNCKISLLNSLFSDKKKALVNPYYPENESYTEDKETICFNGPYDDDKKIRCIKKAM